MTQYSSNVTKCLSNWSIKAQACNGDTNCLEECAKELRECLDIAFPSSTKIDFESDRVNYMLSTIFFLSNRLAKAVVGLSEFDNALEEVKDVGRHSLDSGDNKSIYENMKKELNDILAKYF